MFVRKKLRTNTSSVTAAVACGVISQKMNTKILTSNISEALEELNRINSELATNLLDEVSFQIKLQHVYHHLNIAWNARNITTELYRNMSDEDFEKWGSYPKDIEFEE